MKKIQWFDSEKYDIYDELGKFVKTACKGISQEKLREVRDREEPVLELTFKLEDLGIDGVKVEDVLNCAYIPYFEVGDYLLESTQATLTSNAFNYAKERNLNNPKGLTIMVDPNGQTMTIPIIVIDKRKDRMEFYSDDEGYGWAVPIKDYSSVTACVQENWNFNNGLCIISKEEKGA